jgi:hypothetical protein
MGSAFIEGTTQRNFTLTQPGSVEEKLIIAAVLTFSSSAMAQATLITDRINAMDW